MPKEQWSYISKIGYKRAAPHEPSWGRQEAQGFRIQS